MLNNTPSLYPDRNEFSVMKEQAELLRSTGFIPSSIKNTAQAIAIMLKGREVGMPAMQSFSQINIIQGKPSISAEGMLALILRNHPSTKITYKQNDDEACTIEVTRQGNEPATFSFSFEDAKKARLTGKDNWSKYRRAMLRSRAISEMARALFPDALMGISYTPEELELEPIAVKAEIVPEAVVVVEPVNVDELYNPGNNEHKRILANEIKKIDPNISPENMKDISNDVVSEKVKVKDIEEYLNHIMTR